MLIVATHFASDNQTGPILKIPWQ